MSYRGLEEEKLRKRIASGQVKETVSVLNACEILGRLYVEGPIHMNNTFIYPDDCGCGLVTLSAELENVACVVSTYDSGKVGVEWFVLAGGDDDEGFEFSGEVDSVDEAIELIRDQFPGYGG